MTTLSPLQSLHYNWNVICAITSWENGTCGTLKLVNLKPLHALAADSLWGHCMCSTCSSKEMKEKVMQGHDPCVPHTSRGAVGQAVTTEVSPRPFKSRLTGPQPGNISLTLKYERTMVVEKLLFSCKHFLIIINILTSFWKDIKSTDLPQNIPVNIA